MKYEIVFKGLSKLKEAIVSSVKLNDNFKKTKETLNTISSKKLNDNLKDANKNLDKIASKPIKKPKKDLKEVNEQLVALKKLASEELGFGELEKSGKKLNVITNAMGKGKAMENVKKVFGAFNTEFSRGISAGQGFFSSVSRGFTGMLKMIKLGIGGFKVLAGSIATIALPIVAAVAAFKILQQMWKLNVGGMQSRWGKFMGEMKSTLGKFTAEFNKVLRSLGPLLNFLFDGIGRNLQLVWAIMKGLFKGVWAIVKPIFDAFSEISKVITEAFGMKGGELKGFSSLLKGIEWVLVGIGKAIGWIVKLSLKPLIFGFQLLATGINIIKKGAEITLGNIWKMLKGIGNWIKSTPIFQPFIKMLIKVKDIFANFKDFIITTLKSIWDFIVGILNKVPDVFLPKSLQDLKTVNSPAAEANTTNVSNKREINNNQQITFNTGRGTTPDQSQMFAELLIAQLSR